MLRWLIYFWLRPIFGLGLFGIGAGPSRQETGLEGTEAAAGNFGISTGEGDVLKASNFWSAILSGDMSKISQVLGPEMSAANKQGQEQKKTTAEFGNRGGGTNAATQMIDTNTLSSIRSMIGKLMPAAADSLASTGTSLFSTGASATSSAFDMSKVIHDQNQAKWNDIFSSIGDISGVAGGFFAPGSTMRKGLTGLAGVLGG